MDDSSNISLLPQNTDFVNPEGPALDVPDVLKEAPAAAPPPPDQPQTPEGPKLPDREALLNDLEEKIDGFFGFARNRSGKIQESVDGTNRLNKSLEELIGN